MLKRRRRSVCRVMRYGIPSCDRPPCGVASRAVMTSDKLQVEPRVTPAAPRSGILSLAPHQRALRARIVIGVLAAGVAWASLPFLAGLLGAVVLAALLAPLHRRMAP